MIDIKTVLESRILFARHLNKVFHQTVFRNSEGLSDNNIVSLREKRKRKLHEIQTS